MTQEVYNTMNGPSEFHVIGTIKDFDILDRLGEIRVPTLVTGGRYDEVTPAVTESVHRAIPGSQWVIFEQSAHLAHAEEQERYMEVLDAFLSRVETARACPVPAPVPLLTPVDPQHLCLAGGWGEPSPQVPPKGAEGEIEMATCHRPHGY